MDVVAVLVSADMVHIVVLVVPAAMHSPASVESALVVLDKS